MSVGSFSGFVCFVCFSGFVGSAGAGAGISRRILTSVSDASSLAMSRSAASTTTKRRGRSWSVFEPDRLSARG